MFNETVVSGRSVVVAGAGLAGLTAAVELEKAGARVTVLEARDRLGGRVWTVRDAFADGQHAEGGGDLIDCDHETVRRLATHLGLSLTPVLRGGFAFVGQGTRRGLPENVLVSGAPWLEMTKLCEPWIRAYNLTERSWDGPVAKALARRSVAAWLDDIHADRTLRAGVQSLRGFFLADPGELSMLSLVDQLASESEGRSRFYRIKGGNDRLAVGLAGMLRRPVHLRNTLLASTQRGTRVRITVSGPEGARSQIDADFLILAIPTTTLRHVVLTPPLPALQSRAIQCLRYGRATKTLLQFDRPFWRRRGHPRAYGTDLPIGALWDGNEEQRGRAGILALLAGASASHSTGKLLAQRGARGIADALQWLGSGQADLVASRVVRWENDPWVKGGYAVFHRGFDPELRTWLARPHGRVIFAGEHTSLRWQGYMNGAIQSGLRAAAEVVVLAGRSRRSRRG